MPKLNLRNGTVLYTGAMTALLQYFVESSNVDGKTVSTVIGSVLTILVAVHGALTSSIFEKSKKAQTAANLVSEGETILTDVEGVK